MLAQVSKLCEAHSIASGGIEKNKQVERARKASVEEEDKRESEQVQIEERRIDHVSEAVGNSGHLQMSNTPRHTGWGGQHAGDSFAVSRNVLIG